MPSLSLGLIELTRPSADGSGDARAASAAGRRLLLPRDGRRHPVNHPPPGSVNLKVDFRDIQPGPARARAPAGLDRTIMVMVLRAADRPRVEMPRHCAGGTDSDSEPGVRIIGLPVSESSQARRSAS